MPIFLEKLRTQESTFKLSDTIIRVSGPDAEQYLHSQTTNNVKGLKSNSFHFNSILEPTGKLITSFILVRESESQFTVICPDKFIEDTITRLDKFHISEDFEIQKTEEKAFLKTNAKNGKFVGKFFFDQDEVFFSKKSEQCSPEDEYNVLKVLTGVSQVGEEIKQGDLINNTILESIAVDFNKGCYPGQETVSKISTRRGAALSPVLLISKNKPLLGKLLKEGKGVGELLKVVHIGDIYYSYCLINREHRVDRLDLSLNSGESLIEFKLHYYPYLKPDLKDLAVDLYDHAVELFYNDENEAALLYFNKAIEYNPTFEDAYESLGVLYGRLEKFDLAIESMEKLKSINPKCMMAYTNLSLYHMKVGNIDIAEDFKSQATLLNFEILGDEAEKKRKEMEVEKRKLAERDRREGMFKQVLEMDSEDAMANNGMGEIHLERREFDQACIYFKNAIASNKKYSVAYLGLIKSLYQLNKIAELGPILQEGIAIASKNGDLMPANEMQSILNKLNSVQG